MCRLTSRDRSCLGTAVFSQHPNVTIDHGFRTLIFLAGAMADLAPKMLLQGAFLSLLSTGSFRSFDMPAISSSARDRNSVRVGDVA